MTNRFHEAWDLNEQLLKARDQFFEQSCQSTHEKLSKLDLQVTTFRERLRDFALDGLQQSKSATHTIIDSLEEISKKLINLERGKGVSAAAIAHLQGDFAKTRNRLNAELESMERLIKSENARSLENDSREVNRASAMRISMLQNSIGDFGPINGQFASFGQSVQGVGRFVSEMALNGDRSCAEFCKALSSIVVPCTVRWYDFSHLNLP